MPKEELQENREQAFSHEPRVQVEKQGRSEGEPKGVTVKLYGHLATLAGRDQYNTPPATVGEILRNLAAGLPEATAQHLIDFETDTFNIHLVLGDENLSLPGTLDRDLHTGETLTVVSSVAGG